MSEAHDVRFYVKAKSSVDREMFSVRQVAEYQERGGDIWRLRMYHCDAYDRVCIGTGHHAFCPHCREKMGRDDVRS